MKKIVEAVTVDDVKRVASKYFENKPEVIAVVRPKAKEAQPAAE